MAGSVNIVGPGSKIYQYLEVSGLRVVTTKLANTVTMGYLTTAQILTRPVPLTAQILSVCATVALKTFK